VLQRVLQETGAGKDRQRRRREPNFLEMATMADKGFLAKFTGPALNKVQSAGKFDDWTATRFKSCCPPGTPR